MDHHLRWVSMILDIALLSIFVEKRFILFFDDVENWTFNVFALCWGVWWKQTHKIKFICLFGVSLVFYWDLKFISTKISNWTNLSVIFPKRWIYRTKYSLWFLVEYWQFLDKISVKSMIRNYILLNQALINKPIWCFIFLVWSKGIQLIRYFLFKINFWKWNARL